MFARIPEPIEARHLHELTAETTQEASIHASQGFTVGALTATGLTEVGLTESQLASNQQQGYLPDAIGFAPDLLEAPVTATGFQRGIVHAIPYQFDHTLAQVSG